MSRKFTKTFFKRELPRSFFYAFTIFFALLAAGAVAAWTGPLSSPPTCNPGNPGCDAPLNISSTPQGKLGNLGIGTLNPQTTLEVNGALKFTNSSSDANDGRIGSGLFAAGLNLVGINTDSTYRKINIWGGITQNQNDGGNSWSGNSYFPGSGIWNSSGNVGIGTTNPAAKLDVEGSGSNGWSGEFNGSNGVYASDSSGYYSELAQGSWGLYTNGNIGTGGVTLATNGDLYMPWAGEWLSQALSQKGSVSGSGSTSYIPMWSSGTALTNTNMYDSGGTLINNGPSNNWSIEGIGSGYGVYGQGGTYGVYGLTSSGNGVNGISTDGSGVLGNSSDGNGVVGQSNSGSGVLGQSSSGFGAYGQSGSGIGVYANNSNGNNWAGWFTGGLGVYSTDSSGYFTELDNSSWGLITNGNAQAAGWYAYSDERLKDNISSIADSTALADVLALNPVTFNWKNSLMGTTTQIGFIAQQVQQVVPEIVSTDASTTMEAVDYSRVTPLLVGAAQAQEQKIDALQTQVTTQQQEIDQLTAEVGALEAGKN